MKLWWNTFLWVVLVLPVAVIRFYSRGSDMFSRVNFLNSSPSPAGGFSFKGKLASGSHSAGQEGARNIWQAPHQDATNERCEILSEKRDSRRPHSVLKVQPRSAELLQKNKKHSSTSSGSTSLVLFVLIPFPSIIHTSSTQSAIFFHTPSYTSLLVFPVFLEKQSCAFLLLFLHYQVQHFVSSLCFFPAGSVCLL